MLLKDFIRNNSLCLTRLYPEKEAETIVLRLCEDRLGVKSWTHILEPEATVPEDKTAGLDRDMERLKQGEPLQYVLGWSEFCGFRFNVGPGVLIPRPETEELVTHACERLRGLGRPGRVLDLCTGSGCIAWSIAALVPGTSVTATDISEDALGIAQKQGTAAFSAISGFIEPQFIREDVLGPSSIAEGKFDLLTSNPPYIRVSEKALMRRNVLDFEPSQALFVSDEDPLLFYKAIAAKAAVLLSEGGRGIVEINEALGEETGAVFTSGGFRNVDIFKDFLGKNRFVSFTK